MKYDWNTTLTHLYGAISLALGLVGLVAAFRSDSTVSEMLLFGSGWAVTVFLGVLLIRDYNRARTDGEEIGRLKEAIRGMERELTARNQTLDYIASLHVPQKALPRSTRKASPETSQQQKPGDVLND